MHQVYWTLQWEIICCFFSLSLILDVHFAIVSFLRINSSFILIVYRMYPIYNRIVLISMLGVVIYVCTIQHRAKNYEMHGKMSRPCSMEVIENDQPQRVCPDHRPWRQNMRRMTMMMMMMKTNILILKKKTMMNPWKRKSNWRKMKKRKNRKRKEDLFSQLHHRLKSRKYEQRKFQHIMLFHRQLRMNKCRIWICSSLRHYYHHCHHQLSLIIFHFLHLYHQRIPQIGYNSFVHLYSFRAHFDSHLQLFHDDFHSNSIIHMHQWSAVVHIQHLNHPFKNMNNLKLLHFDVVICLSSSCSQSISTRIH